MVKHTLDLIVIEVSVGSWCNAKLFRICYDDQSFSNLSPASLRWTTGRAPDPEIVPIFAYKDVKLVMMNGWRFLYFAEKRLCADDILEEIKNLNR